MGAAVGSSHIVSVTPSSQGERSSNSSAAAAQGPSLGRQSSTKCSNVSPSHELQLFMNCPSVGSSHRVQSFRSSLLQHVSPMGSQVLPANLLQHSLLSPWVHKSCQEYAVVQVTASFGGPSGVGSSMGCRWISVPLCTSMGCSETACLTRIFSRGFRGLSTLVSRALPPPPSSLTLVSAELFLSHILTLLSVLKLLLHGNFFPFINCYHRDTITVTDAIGLVQWWVHLGALFVAGEGSHSFSQRQPL